MSDDKKHEYKHGYGSYCKCGKRYDDEIHCVSSNEVSEIDLFTENSEHCISCGAFRQGTVCGKCESDSKIQALEKQVESLQHFYYKYCRLYQEEKTKRKELELEIKVSAENRGL